LQRFHDAVAQGPGLRGACLSKWQAMSKPLKRLALPVSEGSARPSGVQFLTGAREASHPSQLLSSGKYWRSGPTHLQFRI
jgi:hypothetical protein